MIQEKFHDRDIVIQKPDLLISYSSPTSKSTINNDDVQLLQNMMKTKNLDFTTPPPSSRILFSSTSPGRRRRPSTVANTSDYCVYERYNKNKKDTSPNMNEHDNNNSNKKESFNHYSGMQTFPTNLRRKKRRHKKTAPSNNTPTNNKPNNDNNDYNNTHHREELMCTSPPRAKTAGNILNGSRPPTPSNSMKRMINSYSTHHHHHHHHHHSSPTMTGKKSIENWIPEEFRSQMLKRNLAIAKENYESCYLNNLSFSSRRTMNQTTNVNGTICKTMHTNRSPGNKEENETKQDLILARSLSKEKYGIEQRKPCGLCGLKFLPLNLVMAVTFKAVLDIRDSWGDKYDPEGKKHVMVNPNLRKAPACYNQTRVCAFCSQLFDQQQDHYRPSWEAKEAEKERIRRNEEDTKRKILNDPLSQMEKERIEQITGEQR